MGLKTGVGLKNTGITVNGSIKLTLFKCNPMIIFTHHYKSYTKGFLPCADTAEVTPNCWADWTITQTPSSHSRHWVSAVVRPPEQWKQGALRTITTTLPLWLWWWRRPFALIYQFDPYPAPRPLALDESEHEERKGCRKRQQLKRRLEGTKTEWRLQ